MNALVYYFNIIYRFRYASMKLFFEDDNSRLSEIKKQ